MLIHRISDLSGDVKRIEEEIDAVSFVKAD